MKKVKNYISMVKLIIDPRDGRLDKLIPEEEAKRLYKEGKLDYDLTSGGYCYPERKFKK